MAAVNNDGDLPYDTSEDDDMDNLLQEEMEKQGERTWAGLQFRKGSFTA